MNFSDQICMDWQIRYLSFTQTPPFQKTRRDENVGGGYSLEFLVDSMAYTQRDQEGAENSNSVAPLGFSRKFVFCFRQILFIRKYVTF